MGRRRGIEHQQGRRDRVTQQRPQRVADHEHPHPLGDVVFGAHGFRDEGIYEAVQQRFRRCGLHGSPLGMSDVITS